jgi:antirestriction protein ArdC
VKNLQADITARILGTMQTGSLPWRRPWRAIAAEGFPCNAVTNRPYSGGNVMLIWLRQQAEAWPSLRFLTFKQAKAAGGSVRKGEHGVNIIFMSYIEKVEDGKKKRVGFLKGYTVFNVAQCDGLPESLTHHTPAVVLSADERDAHAEDFLKTTGASIAHDGGSRAFYRPSTDSIHLPVFESFVSSEAFYATTFHELAHWTGHESRLDRGKVNRKGDQAYAFEELVAEIASSFVCAEFQMENVDNTAAYLQSWITLLKDDDRAFLRAASAASKAVDFLRGLAVAEEVEEAA